MGRLSNYKFENISGLLEKVGECSKECSALEEAAQHVAEFMYKEFKESIVLVRLFATGPLEKLPATNKKEVTKLAEAKKVKNLLTDQTQVLSLLGTAGKKDSWNDRRKSQGHIGIPLLSSQFVEGIPMMSRLLKELGLGLDWIDDKDTKIISKAIGKTGVFYVPDAKMSTDAKGRKIIAAQDFVAEHQVKTCFGFGGSYMLSNCFITIIFFTNETVEKKQIELFLPIVNILKGATTKNVADGKIFVA